MSERSPYERLREMVGKLDELQRESEHIRRRIDSIRNREPEWPYPGDGHDDYANSGGRAADR